MCLLCVCRRFASLGERGEGSLGSFLRVTYGVGVGGVEVGAHDALLLDFGEDLFGDWVGECHVNGLGWLCCVVGLEGVCLGWVFGWEWKGREGGWKAFVGEEKGVDWTGLGNKRWVHVCLEGQWHVNVTGQVRSRFRGTRLLSCDARFFCGLFLLAFTSMRRMSGVDGWSEVCNGRSMLFTGMQPLKELNGRNQMW